MRIVFAGTPDFAVASLSAILDTPHRIVGVLTQPDRPSGRGRNLLSSPVKQLAVDSGLEVFQPRTLKEPGIQEQLDGLNTDLMVVAAYGLILPRSVLDIPVHGCINVHASLLPRWRGAAPIQHAILEGDSESGITIMQMDAGLDSGDILLQRSIPVDANDTGGTLHDKLAKLGGELLKQALVDLEAGTLKGVAQDPSQVTYARKIAKSDSFVDWSDSAARIWRKVRAFRPWPVAQTRFGDRVLRIWSAEPLPVKAARESEPGTVLETGGRDAIEVATGDGVLRLTEVQLPGRRPVPASAFLNAHSLEGVRFESAIAGSDGGA